MKSKRITQTAPKARKPKLPKLDRIEMPDGSSETAHTQFGKYILFASIEHDDSASNPCKEWDGFGAIRSLSRRHIDSIDIDEARELLKSDADVIPLSYFEHGNSLWMVMNAPTPAGVEFQWDGVEFAGIWIPDKDVRESYTGQDGLTRRQWMVKQAASACEIYTYFCNGEVYGYRLDLYLLRREGGEVYTDRDDYRFTKAIWQDACWGYYGWDDAKEQTLEAAKYGLLKLGYSKRAVAKIMEASK